MTVVPSVGVGQILYWKDYKKIWDITFKPAKGVAKAAFITMRSDSLAVSLICYFAFSPCVPLPIWKLNHVCIPSTRRSPDSCLWRGHGTSTWLFGGENTNNGKPFLISSLVPRRKKFRSNLYAGIHRAFDVRRTNMRCTAPYAGGSARTCNEAWSLRSRQVSYQNKDIIII